MNPKLTQTRADKDFFTRIVPGMMHLCGSGPAGATCLGCAHFERAEAKIKERDPVNPRVSIKKTIPDPPNGYCGKLRSYRKRQPEKIKDFYQACSHWRAKE